MQLEVDIAALMLEESVCWKKEIKVELFGCINCGRQGETLAPRYVQLALFIPPLRRIPGEKRGQRSKNAFFFQRFCFTMHY